MENGNFGELSGPLKSTGSLCTLAHRVERQSAQKSKTKNGRCQLGVQFLYWFSYFGNSELKWANSRQSLDLCSEYFVFRSRGFCRFTV